MKKKLNMEINEVKAIRKSLIKISRAYGDIVDWCKGDIEPEENLNDDWVWNLSPEGDIPTSYLVDLVVDWDEDEGVYHLDADDMRTINGWLEDAADRATALKQEADAAIKRIDDGKVDEDELESLKDWADDNKEVLNDENVEWLNSFMRE